MATKGFVEVLIQRLIGMLMSVSATVPLLYR
jgi:hypothetical protein